MPEKMAGPSPAGGAEHSLVGAVLAYEETGLTAAFPATWAINGLTVGAGEAIACYGLGMLLLWQLPKIPYFRDHGCR